MPSETSTVHVIDDDEALRDSLTFLLRANGFVAKSHPSAGAFLDSLPGVEIGCIISDVRMPGLSGIDLLRRLKELGVGVPVIVVTGHGDVPLAVEAMKFGAVDFLEKPFDDEILLASVRSALHCMPERPGDNPDARRSKSGWQNCLRVSATYLTVWLPAVPISRSHSISVSALAPWRYTGPI